MVVEALDEAGRRRLVEVVPSVAALARDAAGSGDGEVALRAVGLLGILRDPRAVKTLGSLAVSQTPEIPFAAVQSLGDIGGGEARRALDLVADQTTSPVIDEAARDVLKRMDRP